MRKPTEAQLNQNWIDIIKIESTVREVKNLSIKGKVPLKCYQSLKASCSKILNDLYVQRSSLIATYKQDMKKFIDWEWKQAKENYINNQKDFDSLVATMTKGDREVLRKFWYKL